MATLELKNAGDTATLTITSVEIVEGDYSPRIKFEADNGDSLFVPQSSLDRQMDRTGAADYAGLVGTTLTFFRAPNKKAGGKPFWNIDRATATDVRTPASGNGKPITSQHPTKPEGMTVGVLPNDAPAEQETGAPPAKNGTEEAIEFRAYRKCATWYLRHMVPLMDAAEVGTTPESVTAGIATLYISLQKKL